MKNIILFIVFFVFLFFSCNKENKIFNDNAKDCIYNFEMPCSDSINVKNYFKGSIADQDVCIFDGKDDYLYEVFDVLYFVSKPGEAVNSSDSSKIDGFGLALGFKKHGDKLYPFNYSIRTPKYKYNTSAIDIVDDISKYKELPLVNDDIDQSGGYELRFIIPCDKYQLDPMLFSTNIIWADKHYNDQSGKRIEVVEFKKKKLFSGWIYDITFDIDVNIYTRRGYYGELKGIYKTHFSLKE